MKKIQLSLVLLFVGLSFTACGGSASPSTSLDVTMTEFAFAPDEYTVPAGENITIHLVNNGVQVHQFTIMKLGTTMSANFTAEDAANVYWQLDVDPGKDATTVFIAPSEPGEYQVICATAGHYPAGMIATMNVVTP